MKSSTVILFGLASIATALPQPLSSSKSALHKRQATISDPGISLPCNGVESCDLTKDEWDAFNIDDYLLFNIGALGPQQPNFPERFATDNGGADLSGCASLDGTCSHASGQSQSTLLSIDSCPNVVQDSICTRYADTRAAIVIENWIQLHEGMKLQAQAISNARDNLVSSNFVSDLLDGMAEEKGDFTQEILDFVITLPLQLITFPVRAVKIAIEAFVLLDNLTIDFLPNGGVSPFIKQAVANQQIEDEKERVKDQMARQIDLIVQGEQDRLTFLLESVFNGVQEENIFIADDKDAAARNTNIFKFAQSGAFLNNKGDGGATLEELTAAGEETIKNTIVNAVMQTFGWHAIRIFGLALEVPGNPNDQTACRRGQKGLPNELGAPCVLFRRGSSESDPKMENPDVIEQFVDWPRMANNADVCAGGQADTSPNAEIGQDGLPKCFFNFPVETINLGA